MVPPNVSDDLGQPKTVEVAHVRDVISDEDYLQLLNLASFWGW